MKQTGPNLSDRRSGAVGIAPGSWVTLYGSKLAASNRVLTSSDVTNKALAASLRGVSVQIDGSQPRADQCARARGHQQRCGRCSGYEFGGQFQRRTE